MVKLTSICVHGYFGGMEMGIAQQPGVEVLGSWEDWGPGMEARRCAKCSYLSELQPLNHAKVPNVDFVFGNPPCSRFSLTAQWTFAPGSQDDLSKFQQLEELVHVAMRADARLVWWETGPLCWTKGRGMIDSVSSELARNWGRCHSTLVRFDLRYTGNPQRRPRCHVIHHKDPLIVGNKDKTEKNWPTKETAWQWVERRLRETNTSPLRPVVPEQWLGKRSPNQLARLMNILGTINHTKPSILREKDNYVPAVVSGRAAVWEHLDRWVTIEEDCLLMSIDPALGAKVYDEMGGDKALMFLSKGVSPTASGFVFNHVVKPILTKKPAWVGDLAVGYDMTNPKRQRYEIDCGIRDVEAKRRGGEYEFRIDEGRE